MREFNKFVNHRKLNRVDSMSGLNSDFESCIDRKEKGGLLFIDCKLGLWGVSGSNKGQVESEATHYYLQYKSDGEYSSIIGGKTVIEMLIK